MILTAEGLNPQKSLKKEHTLVICQASKFWTVKRCFDTQDYKNNSNHQNHHAVNDTANLLLNIVATKKFKK